MRTISPYISSIIRYVLTALFFYTVFHKLDNINLFESSLLKSSLIDKDQVTIVKYGLIVSEIVVIIILLLRKFINGLYISFFLLFIFTIYLIVLNNFSIYDGCSCGGVFSLMSYTSHLLVNAFFIILNLIAIFTYQKEDFEIK